MTETQEDKWTNREKEKTMNENQILISQPSSPETDATSFLKRLKHGLCLASIWMSSQLTTACQPLLPYYLSLRANLQRKVSEMLTAMDKGIEAAQVATPPVGVYEGVDLRILPRYIAFKAAMLKSQSTLQYIVALVVAVLVSNFAISRYEINSLEKKLREKEYILAPGALDFATASPQTVSDEYVTDAAMTFLGMLGNVNAAGIDEQYHRLSSFMSSQLKVQFEEEATAWRENVKSENISETLKITDRHIVATSQGVYRATVLANRERYANGENMGRTEEIIEMTMKLVPPERGKMWFLEITSLKRAKSDGQKISQPLTKTK